MGLRFSFSTLSLQCPRRISKSLHRDPPEVMPSDVAELGRAIHNTLAFILSKPRSQWDFSPVYQQTKIYGDLRRTFSRLKGKFIIEEKKRLRVAKHILTIIPDLVVVRRGERDIIDHKTTFSNEVTPKNRQQLEYYALPFLREGYKVRIGIHFVHYAEIQWLEILEGLDDYAAIVAKLKLKIDKALQYYRDPEPKPEPSLYECTYCPYVVSCPSKPKLQITSDFEAGKLVKEYIKLKNKLAKIEQILRAWSSYVGTIYIQDAKAGFDASSKTIVDSWGIIEYVQDPKNNVNLTDIIKYLRISPKHARELVKMYDELAQFVDTVYRPRWSVSKTEIQEDKVVKAIEVESDMYRSKVEKAKAKINEIIKPKIGGK